MKEFITVYWSKELSENSQSTYFYDLDQFIRSIPWSDRQFEDASFD